MGQAAQSSICFRVFWPRSMESTEARLIPKDLFAVPVCDIQYREGLLRDFVVPADAKAVMIVNVASN